MERLVVVTADTALPGKKRRTVERAREVNGKDDRPMMISSPPNLRHILHRPTLPSSVRPSSPSSISTSALTPVSINVPRLIVGTPPTSTISSLVPSASSSHRFESDHSRPRVANFEIAMDSAALTTLSERLPLLFYTQRSSDYSTDEECASRDERMDDNDRRHTPYDVDRHTQTLARPRRCSLSWSRLYYDCDDRSSPRKRGYYCRALGTVTAVAAFVALTGSSRGGRTTGGGRARTYSTNPEVRRLMADYYPNPHPPTMASITDSTTSPKRGNRNTSSRTSSPLNATTVRIAFVGNSMLYFNDFPRFFSTLTHSGSHGHVVVQQDSCLRGGASIPSLIQDGNGMLPQFLTPPAFLTAASHNDTKDVRLIDGGPVYDYGACTVQQLLTGADPSLLANTSPMEKFHVPTSETSVISRNPCRVDATYRQWTQRHLLPSSPPPRRGRTRSAEPPHDNGSGGGRVEVWDFVVINDSTRDPARLTTRQRSLDELAQTYVPWFTSSAATAHAVPVFLWTHAYVPKLASPYRNMAGLANVADFTSLTGAGYRAYADMLRSRLAERPSSSSDAVSPPLIVPYGLCALLVHEERPELWSRLFHNADHLHASPTGSLLQGLAVHATIFGRMPSVDAVIPPTDPAENGRDEDAPRDLSYLFANARMMQHAWDPPNPMVTADDAHYLWNVARRVVLEGHVPATYIHYEHGEAA